MSIAENAKINTAPTLPARELIIDQIISTLDFSFEIDRAWIRSKNDTYTKEGVQHFSTYVALSPSARQSYPDKEFWEYIATLEDNIIQLFRDPSPIYAINSPDELIKHYSFSCPSVNDYDEHLAFFIEGIHPTLFKSTRDTDTCTLRELAAEIFRSFKTIYAETFPNTPLPDKIKNIHSLHATTKLISVRVQRIKDMKLNILGLTFSTHNPLADILLNEIHKLCITHKQCLIVGGNKINIALRRLPIATENR
jgi:hypothetical protein